MSRLERVAVGQRLEAGRAPDDRTHTAVVALELLRLELLRLHASPESASDLTSEIEAASRIGDEIHARALQRTSSDERARDDRNARSQ